jgi:hypothetical protein
MVVSGRLTEDVHKGCVENNGQSFDLFEDSMGAFARRGVIVSWCIF